MTEVCGNTTYIPFKSSSAFSNDRLQSSPNPCKVSMAIPGTKQFDTRPLDVSAEYPQNDILPNNDNYACNNRVHNDNKHISKDELDSDIHHINYGIDDSVCLLLDNDLTDFVHYYLIDEYASFMDDESTVDTFSPFTTNVMIPPTPVVRHISDSYNSIVPFQYSSNLTTKHRNKRSKPQNFASKKTLKHTFRRSKSRFRAIYGRRGLL